MCNVELSNFIIDIFGKKGPKTLDTQMAEHNFFLEEDLGEEKYQKLVEEDKIDIGREGKNINKTDVRAFLKAFKERQSLEVFHNDRTYFFEGIEMINDTNYEIIWGSVDFSKPPPMILPCPTCESSRENRESSESDKPSTSAPKDVKPRKATVHLISGNKIVKAAKAGKYEDERRYPLYDIEDIERVYPGIKDMVKRGDIFEDIDESGYRSNGVFLYDGEKTINQDHEFDDYGHPPDELKLIIEFPPGYWDVGDLIVNDTSKKPRRTEAESSGTIILSPSFYWHAELASSFLYFDELGIPRDVDTGKVTFTYTHTYRDGTKENRTFSLEHFILDYGGHRYLIDADIAKNAEENKERVNRITGSYGYWACCRANHNAEEDQVFLENLREAMSDPTIDYVLYSDC